MVYWVKKVTSYLLLWIATKNTSTAFVVPLTTITKRVIFSRPLFMGKDNDNVAKEMQEIVGLTEREWNRIASRIPEIESYSTENLKESLEQLRQRLCMNSMQDVKKKIVLRLPQVLGYNFDNDVEPQLQLLQDALGDITNEELAMLISKCPQIIGLDYAKDVKDNVERAMQEHEVQELVQKPVLLDIPVRGASSKRK
mmetsp:Transcript_1518/g.2071  ORF Transcript_1518/g.2071 Transcript_1518/m.2071 type:complete len:197 (+) Transcript_1518:176-766(+)